MAFYLRSSLEHQAIWATMHSLSGVMIDGTEVLEIGTEVVPLSLAHCEEAELSEYCQTGTQLPSGRRISSGHGP